MRGYGGEQLSKIEMENSGKIQKIIRRGGFGYLE